MSTRRRYYLLAKLSDGLVRLDSSAGRQLFTARKVRKDTSCADCGMPIKKGETAFGEVSACAINRMERVCVLCSGVNREPAVKVHDVSCDMDEDCTCGVEQ